MSECDKNTGAATNNTSTLSEEKIKEAKAKAKADRKVAIQSLLQQQDLNDRIEPITDRSAPSQSSQPASTQSSSLAQTVEDATRQVTKTSKKSNVLASFFRKAGGGKDTSSSG